MCGPSSDVYKKNTKQVGNGLKATEKFCRNNQIIAYMPDHVLGQGIQEWTK